MVIDKTTGRGCALSMASKTVTKELVADGIVGKPIYRKLRMNSKRNYDLFRAVKFNKVIVVRVLVGESFQKLRGVVGGIGRFGGSKLAYALQLVCITAHLVSSPLFVGFWG